MKRLICIVLLLALSVCAVAEEGLVWEDVAMDEWAAETAGAEDVSLILDGDGEDAPPELAPDGDLLAPEEPNRRIPGVGIEHAKGPTAERTPGESIAAANGTTKVNSWKEFVQAVQAAGNGDTLIMKYDIQQTGDPAYIIAKNITLDMDSLIIFGDPSSVSILEIQKGGQLTLTGDGEIECGMSINTPSGPRTPAAPFR